MPKYLAQFYDTSNQQSYCAIIERKKPISTSSDLSLFITSAMELINREIIYFKAFDPELSTPPLTTSHKSYIKQIT